MPHFTLTATFSCCTSLVARLVLLSTSNKATEEGPILKITNSHPATFETHLSYCVEMRNEKHLALLKLCLLKLLINAIGIVYIMIITNIDLVSW